MIRIRCIRVLDTEFTTLVVDYPYDLRFEEMSLVEKFREHYRKLYAELTGEEVAVDIDFVDIPKKVDPVSICQLTAAEMDINMDALFGKTRHPDVVLARMFATQICLDAFIPPSHIEEKTPFKNRIYSHYRNKLADRRETDDELDVRYKTICDNVMTKLTQ
jgi:hypothetical protein